MLGPTTFEAAGASERLELTISGMTCGHCVGAVRAALNELPGVAVDHVGIGHASLRFEPATVSPAAMIEALRDAGYPASFGPSMPPEGTDDRAPAKAELPQAPTGGSCCSSR